MRVFLFSKFKKKEVVQKVVVEKVVVEKVDAIKPWLLWFEDINSGINFVVVDEVLFGDFLDEVGREKKRRIIVTNENQAFVYPKYLKILGEGVIKNTHYVTDIDKYFVEDRSVFKKRTENIIGFYNSLIYLFSYSVLFVLLIYYSVSIMGSWSYGESEFNDIVGKAIIWIGEVWRQKFYFCFLRPKMKLKMNFYEYVEFEQRYWKFVEIFLFVVIVYEALRLVWFGFQWFSGNGLVV